MAKPLSKVAALSRRARAARTSLVSAPGVFGNRELEDLARGVALQCREELFTTRVPYGPMTAAQAKRVDEFQQLLLDDARWAMRAGAIRAGVYADIDGCERFRQFADKFVQEHPALARQAASGIILAPG
jgi:hypothetical protein